MTEKIENEENEENKEKEEVTLYKILILGDTTVGKTSLLLQFCEEKFDPETLTTVGIDYKRKFIIRHGKKILLQICDTAGQERFRSIAKNYFKNCDGIIVVYDITKISSFENIKIWISSIKDNIDLDKIGLVIVGNKIDLENNREVDAEMRHTFEERQQIKIIETSAKNNINVNEAFIEIIDQLEKLGLGVKHQSEYGYDEDINSESKSVKITKEAFKKKNNNNNSNCCSSKKHNKKKKNTDK